MDECKPLPAARGVDAVGEGRGQERGEQVQEPGGARAQGLTLVHFSAQRQRFLWIRGCIAGLFKWCVCGFRGYEGWYRVCFMS